jgi:uncharacterized repeat protein (TIGR03803 family)
VLYSFDWSEQQYGYAPQGGLVFDKVGNLYGTTSAGGAGSQCADGCGTVYELSPQFFPPWAESVLHSFSGSPKDASAPFTSLTIDPAGHLYGVASHSGAYNAGAAFEVAP